MTRFGALLIDLLTPMADDPEALAALHLTPDDINTAIRVIKVLFTSDIKE